MSIKKFLVTGTFRMGTERNNFSKEVNALTKDDALEKVYSVIGGKHRCPKHLIKINEVKESEV